MKHATGCNAFSLDLVSCAVVLFINVAGKLNSLY